MRITVRCGRRLVAVIGLVALAAATGASAERLPVARLTTADGLAHDLVRRIYRDSRGFLWFCTREGLSRFDGRDFVNYGAADGLPGGVNDIVETGDGRYWVATSQGLVRFDPTGDRRFALYGAGRPGTPGAATTLHLETDGRVWVGTLTGAFRIDVTTPGAVPRAAAFAVPGVEVTSFAGRGDTLWIGTTAGLYRLRRAGAGAERVLTQVVVSVCLDSSGRVWVGTPTGLSVIADPGEDGRPLRPDSITTADGLPPGWVHHVVQSEGGRVLAVTTAGVVRIDRESGVRITRFEFGVPTATSILSALEDRGVLWVGTSRGVLKAAAAGVGIYDAHDGVPSAGGIFDGCRHGIVVMGADAEWQLRVHENGRFTPVRLGRAGGLATWGWNQVTVIDREGALWTATRTGLYRFDPVPRLTDLADRVPRAVYSRRTGLPHDVVLRLFEDGRGDIWASTVGEGQGANGLSRWRRATGAWEHFTERDGFPSLERNYVSAFAEDGTGNLWIGLSGDGGLVRWRPGGVKRFGASEGVPPGAIRNLLVDRGGRLWATS